MAIGAILADAPDREREIVEQAALEAGLAFQIQDDILDVTSSLEVLGKPIGSDSKNQKTTYLTLEGMERAREDVRRLFQNAVEKIEALPGKNPFLPELLRYLIHREK